MADHGAMPTRFSRRFGDVEPKGVTAVTEARRTGGLSLGVESVYWWSDHEFDEIRFCEQVALRQEPGVPFLTAIGDRALVSMCGPFSSPEFMSLASAVEAGFVTLESRAFLHPAYAVVGFVFCIEDNPLDPFCVEVLADLANVDIQEFAVAFDSSSYAVFNLVSAPYLGGAVGHARGRVSLAGADSPRPMARFEATLRRAVAHLQTIPEAARSFALASNDYLATTCV